MSGASKLSRAEDPKFVTLIGQCLADNSRARENSRGSASPRQTLCAPLVVNRARYDGKSAAPAIGAADAPSNIFQRHRFRRNGECASGSELYLSSRKIFCIGTDGLTVTDVSLLSPHPTSPTTIRVAII